MRRVSVLVVILVGAAIYGSGVADAATLQPIGNFEKPIYVTSDPGNPDRLFVVERGGRIKKVEGGSVTTFADLTSIIGCGVGVCGESGNERGLLSIALAPDFAATGRFYVDYAQNTTGEIHVAELVAPGGSALGAIPRDVLVIPHPGNKNHNGGQLQFGPEGNLFISTGDGGGSNDELHNAQDTESLLGKILRIDPRQSGVLAYTVPPSNPFVGKAGKDEIWNYGLRNPYRFSFDRLTGAMTIGDVGQGKREEVDYAPAPGLGGGANYGWNCFEGSLSGPVAQEDPQCPSPASPFVAPTFEYSSESGAPCAIVGGYVVRDPNLPELYGRYLYGDYCDPELHSLQLALPAASGDRSEGIEVPNLVSFGEDSCGRIYTVSQLGEVARLISGAVPSASPPISCIPTSPPPPKKPLTHSYAGIKALHRSVKRGEKALITAWVSPCTGRKGEPVKLFRNGNHIATRHLDRACTARFRPRIGRRWNYRTTITADETYEAASSRKLKIRPQRHRR
jgi:glucose/arabinose dehydrogenase